MKWKNYSTQIIFLIYLAFTLFLTWPLIVNLDGFLLPQEYPDITHSDSIEHIDVIKKSKKLIEENKNPLITNKTDASQVYVFFGVIFSYLGGDFIAYHNLFFMFVLLSSGIFAYLFMYELCKDKLSSFLAGFIYMSSYYIPYAYYWGHSNTVQIEWIPLIFLFLERTLKYKDIKNAIFLGLSITLQILSSSQTTAYISFLLPLYVIIRILIKEENIKNTFFDLKLWKNAGITLLTIVVSSSFYLIQKINTVSITRTLEENMNVLFRLDFIMEILHPDYHLYLGIIQTILFFVAAYLILANIDKNRSFIPFLIIFPVILICMIGPFSIFAPYYFFFKFWPLIDKFRVPFRMYPFALLSMSIVVSSLILNLKAMPKMKRYRFYVVIAIVMIIIIQIMISPWLSNLHIAYG